MPKWFILFTSGRFIHKKADYDNCILLWPENNKIRKTKEFLYIFIHCICYSLIYTYHWSLTQILFMQYKCLFFFVMHQFYFWTMVPQCSKVFHISFGCSIERVSDRAYYKIHPILGRWILFYLLELLGGTRDQILTGVTNLAPNRFEFQHCSTPRQQFVQSRCRVIAQNCWFTMLLYCEVKNDA